MDKGECIALLVEKAQSLGRLPMRSDFDPLIKGEIKNVLGPWPRALEKAGLKPVSDIYKHRVEARHKKRDGSKDKKRSHKDETT